jgi:hypothetical protein
LAKVFSFAIFNTFLKNLRTQGANAFLPTFPTDSAGNGRPMNIGPVRGLRVANKLKGRPHGFDKDGDDDENE